jgi:hypothetical protein
MITFQKCSMDIKNIEFDTDFESFEKTVKKPHEEKVINEKVTKN